ncbi:MAG: RluA family pseudouridine synthase [Clostridia bacterium]|nr:RluA family pseudouridine synthase [Clostridia bacterium]
MLTVISSEYDGMILREYLRNVLRLSRAELTELKKRDDGILLNGVRVTVRALLKEGDELVLSRDDIASSEGVKPVPLPLDILYEDDDVIALNKPPFMPTHPSHEHQSDTLANALAYYFESKGIPFVFRAVNRLDRDTSGVVLVAKNKNSAFVLAKQIAEFKVTKKYIAIVDGEVLSSGKIGGNIRRIEDGKMRRGVFPDGQYALTEYEVLGVKNGLSALLVSPKTGRTHQIRVHTSYIGHPILGDTLYGNENGSELISRQALHAYSLTFSLPSNNETITVTAPLPSDMASIGVYEQDQD